MFDVIVVGKGMIGSAAARHLSKMGQSVALVGPDEPADFKTHTGVFASHYDQGRITRILDPNQIWGRMAQMAQEAYAEIEAESGIRFHHPVGGVRAMGHAGAAEQFAQVSRFGQEREADFQAMSPAEINAARPFFDFPNQTLILWEQGMAGYVNPRQFVAAEVACAEKNGASIVRETVLSLEKNRDHITIHTDLGTILQAKKVLLATAAFTNKLLPNRPLALKREAHMILMAEIGPAEQERLAGMPTLIHKLPAGQAMNDLYMLPPIRYPDGRTYIKLGGETVWSPKIFEDWDQITAWFHSDGDPKEASALKTVLLEALPGLKVENYLTKPCILTYTDSKYPYLDQIDERLFTAVGGCGGAAKSADAIGRLASLRLLDEPCPEPFGWEPFKASFA